MDGEGLRAALATLGWSGRHLAERTGVHPNSVTAWLKDRVEVPGSVSAYLTLAGSVVALAKTLERPKAVRPRGRSTGLFVRKVAPKSR